VARAYKNTKAGLNVDRATISRQTLNVMCPVRHRAEIVGGTCPHCKVGIPDDARELRQSRPRIERQGKDSPTQGGDSLTDLFSEDSTGKQRKILAALWSRATPRERKFLSLVHTGFNPKDAAVRMGLTDGARRAMLFRLRKKIAPSKKNV
jgi:hypothetical protein